MATTHVVLKGAHRVRRPGAQLLGRTDAHEWCEITMKVRRKAPLPEPSADGKPVLNRADLAEKHGAATADLNQVEKVLSGLGITTQATDAASRTVRAAGTAASMEKAFNVHLFKSRHNNHAYRSRTGDIYLPKELDGVVTAVFGLDTRRMANHRSTAPQRARRTLPPASSRPWFLPQELAQAYAFPPGDGTGQTIGVIELGGEYVHSDLETFATMTGLSVVPSVDVVDAEKLSASDARDQDSIGEVMLDIEVVAGVCPRANIVGYFSNFTEKGWVDVLDSAIHDTAHNPGVLSISWGLAEGQDIWTQQAMDVINDSMKAAATLGMTVCVAAGDDGSDDQVGDGAAHVNFPASSPYVLSVGGTTLIKNGASFTEAVWKEGDGLRADGGGSTGGGVSTVFQRPTYQNGITIQSINPGAINGRIVPDISADAAGGTGYFMVANGQPDVSGGTSAATPLWASLIARLRGAGKQVGYLTPQLYQPSATSGGKPVGAAGCNDITSGNNDTAAAGGYAAGPGYDAVTGWGSPIGTKLAQLLP